MKPPIVVLALSLFAVVGAACGGGDPAAPDASSVTADAGPVLGPPDAMPPPDGRPDAMPQPDAAPPCDPLAQDCGDPGLKCTLVPSGMGINPGCVPLTGAAGDGDPCTDMSGSNDCLAGFTCTSTGTSGMQAYCRRYCGADATCTAAGERCATITFFPTVGNCLPTCTFFGTDCDVGYTCGRLRRDIDNTTFVPTCRAVGAVAIGGACNNMNPCMADAVCQLGTCREECDDTHACAPGTVCMPVAGLANGAGDCE